jgi:DNA polymerase alpha-associated DNA helicase A
MNTTPEQLEAFFARQRELLAVERQAEVEQSSLLISNCSPKLLERKGLALLGLAVVQVSIGLGGKRYEPDFVEIRYL